MKKSKRRLLIFMKLFLGILLLVGVDAIPAFAKPLDSERFIIEAQAIQGVLLPPEIVFLNTDTTHPVPAVVFHYQSATITGMTLVKQLNTEKGSMYIQTKAEKPIHVKDLKVVATSFSFGGACLDSKDLSQAIEMRDVKMAATEMTTAEMDSQGLQLLTGSGQSTIQPPSLPNFLQGIMNESSLSAMKQSAKHLDLDSLLFKCTATSQPSSKTTLGPTTSTLKKDLGNVASDPIKKIAKDTSKITDSLGSKDRGTKGLTAPVKKATDPVKKVIDPIKKATDPVKKVTDPVKKTTDIIKKTTDPIKKTTDTVTQPIKKIVSSPLPSTVTTIVKKPIQAVTKQAATTVTKSVHTTTTLVNKGVKTTAQITNTASKATIELLQNQLSDGLNKTDQLQSDIDSLQGSVNQLSESLLSVQSLLSNPLKLLLVNQQLTQLEDQTNQMQTKKQNLITQLEDLEKCRKALQAKIDSAQIDPEFSTKDWENKLSKEKKTLSSLGDNLQHISTQLDQLLN
ncbi:hypothetical protein PU629_10960 [Pullulanibacillus sp. KACC 23026]|uniref:hypothetical protein n=1 Tax=Pullulanibacillus sp. KACC 23026 TaxID=3028315 RepID=UPI0023AE6E4A|nr:hypothetical protein [Pullulanibacillus sp. KACC 23026]WEG14827.1 hypothetical protein PU629_10960 [Pullulanibacillus sp. KACC 23026]